MTREEAIEVYFSKNKKAREMLERLVKWDPEQDVKGNSIDLGIPYPIAFHVMRKYFSDSNLELK